MNNHTEDPMGEVFAILNPKPCGKWVQKVDIKVFLHDDSTDLATKAGIIATALKRIRVADGDEMGELNDIIEAIESEFVSVEGDGDEDEVMEFDHYLNELYEWADYNKVWLGL